MSEQLTYHKDDDTLVVCLSGRVDASNAPEVEKKIAAVRTAVSGIPVVIDAENLEYISSAGLRILLRLRKKNPDLVISIGGDGTILEAVHQYLDVDCCFVGIHTGTLGFYTDYQVDEVDQFIKDVTSRQFKTMKRYMLEIKINKKDSFQTYYALNELRLDQGLQAQVIHVYIGNVLLEVFRGNGLCVSTPSGSTAYNKSLGGSIIYPGIPLMQLTEVAGIHHNAYRSLGSSLILDESQTIKLVGNHFNHSLIGIDHIHLELEDVESIEITIGRKYVRFIEYKEMSFIKRVRRAFINT